MDFVSTVLSLSQKHDKGANSGRAYRRGERGGSRAGSEQEGKEEHGTNAVESGGKSGAVGAEGEGEKTTRWGGRNARWRERAGIRRNKRGIFVPATNPNGEKRTFLFSFIRQPTYPPTFMSAVSED